MKRLFDILASAAGIVVAGPLLLICMILIRRDSPGPALFRQVRVGRNEVPFVLLKLRTMFSDTRECPSHEVSFSAVTPLGRKLRAWKIDELPQLWNVLRGDMSIVGPRPCLPSQTELIEARRARGVNELRPGVTGISQVQGIDMSDPKKLAEVDALYIEQSGLLCDLRLILATLIGAGRGDRVRKKA
ncbi:sugar transferase [Tepidicaulis marinus]|nr:sugar transferase [Tepidicaulis marinus]